MVALAGWWVCSYRLAAAAETWGAATAIEAALTATAATTASGRGRRAEPARRRSGARAFQAAAPYSAIWGIATTAKMLTLRTASRVQQVGGGGQQGVRDPGAAADQPEQHQEGGDHLDEPGQGVVEVG